eukprot:scaffold5233_cov178-Amphora_coffeaeformis.AAC.5
MTIDGISRRDNDSQDDYRMTIKGATSSPVVSLTFPIPPSWPTLEPGMFLYLSDSSPGGLDIILYSETVDTVPHAARRTGIRLRAYAAATPDRGTLQGTGHDTCSPIVFRTSLFGCRRRMLVILLVARLISSNHGVEQDGQRLHICSSALTRGTTVPPCVACDTAMDDSPCCKLPQGYYSFRGSLLVRFVDSDSHLSLYIPDYRETCGATPFQTKSSKLHGLVYQH